MHICTPREFHSADGSGTTSESLRSACLAGRTCATSNTSSHSPRALFIRTATYVLSFFCVFHVCADKMAQLMPHSGCDSALT